MGKKEPMSTICYELIEITIDLYKELSEKLRDDDVKNSKILNNSIKKNRDSFSADPNTLEGYKNGIVYSSLSYEKSFNRAKEHLKNLLKYYMADFNIKTKAEAGEILCNRIISKLRVLKIDVEKYCEFIIEKSYDQFVEQLYKDAVANIPEETKTRKEKCEEESNYTDEETIQDSNKGDYKVHILFLSDDENVIESINNTIKKCEKKYLNPIIPVFNISDAKNLNYDICYSVTMNNVTDNVDKLISAVSPQNIDKAPYVGLYIKNENEDVGKTIREKCKKANISIKPYIDIKSLTYDLLEDLEKIINSKTKYVRDYTAERYNDLQIKLKEGGIHDIEYDDYFHDLQNALSIYDKTKIEQEILVEEYFAEKIEFINALKKESQINEREAAVKIRDAEDLKDKILAFDEEIHQEARELRNKAKELRKEAAELREKAKKLLDRAVTEYKLLLTLSIKDHIYMKVMWEYANFMYSIYGEGETEAEKYALILLQYIEYVDMTGQTKDIRVGKEDLYLFLGKIYTRRKQNDDAVKYLDMADIITQADEKRAVIEAYKATVLWQSREYVKALDLIKKSIGNVKKLYENDINANTWAYAKMTQIRGSIHHAKDELKTAKKFFEEAVKIWESKKELEDDELVEKLIVYNNTGIVCRKLGLFKEAEKIYDKSIVIRKQLYYENSEKYTLRYARAISNKATLKWWMYTHEELQSKENVKKEIEELYGKSLQLREEISEEKRNKNYMLSLLILHTDYAQYYEKIEEYKNEDTELDKCDECIKTWKLEWGPPSSSDQQMNGAVAEYELVKGRRMLYGLKEGKHPSSACEKLLDSAAKYAEKNYENNGGYLNPLRVRIAIAKARYYLLCDNVEKAKEMLGMAKNNIKDVPEEYREITIMQEEINELSTTIDKKRRNLKRKTDKK